MFFLPLNQRVLVACRLSCRPLNFAFERLLLLTVQFTATTATNACVVLGKVAFVIAPKLSRTFTTFLALPQGIQGLDTDEFPLAWRAGCERNNCAAAHAA